MSRIDNVKKRAAVIEIAKNSMEVLRLHVTEYKGKQFADIRVYYRDDSDELKPTRKGLTLSPGLWPEFIKAVEQLGEDLLQRGLLDGVESESDS